MTAYPTDKSSPRDNGRTRLWVIHDEEFPESVTSAEATCAYLTKPSVRASIHFAVDADSSPDSVPLDRAAWHAAHGKTNACSIGVEHDGYAHQSRAEWLDDVHGEKTLDRSARLFADIGIGRFGIEPVHLTGQALVDCVVKGIGSGYCGHGDVTRAFGIVGGHTDPGDHFPYDWWEARARTYAGVGVNLPAVDPSPQPSEEDDDMKVRFYRGQNDPTVMLASSGLTSVVKIRNPRHLHDTVTLLTENGAEIDATDTTNVDVLDEDNGKVITVPIRIVGDAQAADMLAGAR